MSTPAEDEGQALAVEVAAIIEAVNQKLAPSGARPLGATDLAWAHWRIRVCDLVVLLRAMGLGNAAIADAILAGATTRFDPAQAEVCPPLTLSFEGDQWGTESPASQ